MTARISTLAGLLGRQARARPNAVAVTFEGRSVTFAELERGATEVCALLLAAGLAPGERVAWLGRSCPEFYFVLFGAAQARVCLTPVNARLAPSEIAFVLRDSGARILFITPEFFDVAQTAVSELPGSIRLVAAHRAQGRYRQIGSDRRPKPSASRRPMARDDVLQLYTSGTTGFPKGVRLTNANYAAFLRLGRGAGAFDYRAGEAVLVSMPLFHVAGVDVSVAALAAGARIVLEAEFQPTRVAALINDERIAHAFLAPVMINMLLQTPGVAEADFSGLRTMAYGASPISDAVLARAQAVFGCNFVQLYGMTETTGGGSALPPGAHQGDLLRSCGKPWPGVEMRIADQAGGELPAGEIGEIEIRGPIVMAGYWNRPDATSETIRPDGWLRTGDAGFRNEDGFFFIHDRVKDMIISGGENVYPAEVENAILGCPGVADAAVIGVPDDQWGEAVKAIVVPTGGGRPNPEDIIAYARQRIAGYKAPKSVEFVDALPRNPSGKVLRRELRRPYWEGRGRQVS